MPITVVIISKLYPKLSHSCHIYVLFMNKWYLKICCFSSWFPSLCLATGCNPWTMGSPWRSLAIIYFQLNQNFVLAYLWALPRTRFSSDTQENNSSLCTIWARALQASYSINNADMTTVIGKDNQCLEGANPKEVSVSAHVKSALWSRATAAGMIIALKGIFHHRWACSWA